MEPSAEQAPAPQGEANIQTPISPEPIEPVKSKNTKTLTWIFGILAVIALVATGVFAYLYFTSQPQPTPTSDTPTTIIEPTDDVQASSIPTAAEVAQLLEDKYDFSAEERYFCIGARDIVCGINNFDTDKKLQFIIGHAPETLFTNERYVDVSYIRNIKYDDLNKLYNDYFGSLENINKEDHDFENSYLIGMKYLSESDSFDIQFKDGLGGTTTVSVFNKVVETNESENGFVATIISVTINNVVSSTEEPFSGNSVDGQKLYQMGIPSEDVAEIQESLSAYHFNFLEENGEHKLISIEKL